MTKEQIDLEQPMLRLTFGYSAEYICPWDTGVKILALMKHAIPVVSRYESGKSTWHRQSSTKVTTTCFTPLEQAEVLISGEDN